MLPAEMDYNGQVAQDLFVLTCLNKKRGGIFVEIGSNHPQTINNTWLLETEYGWKGLMVDHDPGYSAAYTAMRPNSRAIILNAEKIDYAAIFAEESYPASLDYLQIDLEAENGSTLAVLKKLNDTVFSNYKFATVTFEHDLYRGDFHDTRASSRAIFETRGYVRVFSDVMNEGNKFEDWYIHPDLVAESIWSPLKREAALEYTTIVEILRGGA